MFDEVISYYLNITSKTKLADVRLKHVIEKIQSDPDIERTVKQIRSQTDKQLRNQLKRRLPAVAVSGTFKDRRSLEHYSGLVQVDFDNLENPAQTKEKLKSDPYTYVAFISPSGNGLKLIVKVQRDAQLHLQNFEALQLYYKQKYNLDLDKQTKDITRLMYLSHDPQIYTNPKAKIFYPPTTVWHKPKQYNKPTEPTSLLEKKVQHIISQIEDKQLDITEQYNNWIAIGFAFADTFDYDKAKEFFHRVSQFHSEYNYDAAQRQFDYCYKYRKDHSTIAAFFSIAKSYGLDISAVSDALDDFNIDLQQPLPKQIDIDNDFGITVQNRSFYKVVDGKKKRLSNFAMQILVNIEDNPHNTIKIIKLQRYDWQKPKILFLRSEKLTFQNIKPVLISSSVTFTGKGSDWNNVLEFLLQNEKTVKLLGADNLGWDAKNRFYVFANAIVDEQGNIYKPNEQGFLTLDDQTYFLPAFSQLEETTNAQNIVDIDFLKNYPLRLGKIDFSQWTRLLIGAYGQKAYIGILFAITAVFRDVVFKTTKIPYLYLFGEYNTGKTSYILNFLSLFTTDEGTSLSSSAKAILRTPSQVKNSLVYFKEFDKNVIKDIENPLLSLYDGVTRNIAKKSTNNATHKNKVHSLMIFDGNYMPALKPNLFSRFIVLSFDGNYTEENLAFYNQLQQAQEQGLGQIFAEILSKRQVFEQNFAQNFKQIRNAHSLFDDKRFDSRIKDHFALFLAVYQTLQNHLEFNFTQNDLTAYLRTLMNEQQDSLNDINDLHVFWEAFNHNVSTDVLTEDFHFKLNKDRTVLAIDYNSVYEKYVEYCKNQNIPPTDKKTIEKLLTSEANPAYIKPEKGKKKTVRFPLRPTSLRALLFKLDGDRIGDFKLYFKQQTSPAN